MKKCKLLAALLFCCAVGFSQTTQRVGVNTDKPGATLDVNGNLTIREVNAEDINNGNYEQLYWNLNTHRIEVPSDTNVQKPFYLVQYGLEANSQGTRDFADFIRDFDTKINADDYYAIITQAYPIPGPHGYYNNVAEHNKYIGIRHVAIDDDSYLPGSDAYEVGKETGRGNRDYNNEVNPIRKVAAFISGGTWHLTLDYLSARPDSYFGGSRRINFDWQVNVLFISKAFAKNIDFGTKSLNNPDEAKGEMGENPLLKK